MSFKIYAAKTEKKEDYPQLLKQAAGLYCGGELDFTLARTPQGKPYFAALSGVEFSVSHSGSFWVCAFGKEKVGLDLQQHTDCRMKDIALRHFHPQEVKWLRENGFSPENFFYLWSAKESYLKYTGLGLSAGLKSFSVFSLAESIQKIDFADGFTMCLCSEKGGKAEIIQL